MTQRFSVIQITPVEFKDTITGAITKMERCILMTAAGELVKKSYPVGIRKVGETLILEPSTYNNAPCLKHVAVLDDATAAAMRKAHTTLSELAASLAF